MTPTLSKARKIFQRIVDQTIFRTVLGPKRNSKPGELIEKMSPEERAILSDLKSDEVAKEGRLI